MAEFDPQFKSQDPTYWHWSKASEQPMANKSTGMLLETVGNAIKGASTLADTTIKGTIDQSLSDQLNQDKQDFINQLDQYQTSHGTPTPQSNPLNANAAAIDQDLMPDKPNVPKAVGQSLTLLQNVQNAKDQGGKMRTTGLDATALETLQRVRRDYPGYRDYIDQKGSQIMGYNVANKLIGDKIAEINEQRTNTQRELERTKQEVINSGFTGADGILKKLEQTGDVSQAQHWLTVNKTRRGVLQDQLQQFQLETGTIQNQQLKAGLALNSAAEQATNDYFYNHHLTEDDPKSPTGKTISDMLIQAQLHPGTLSEPQVQALMTQFTGLQEAARAHVRQLAAGTVNKGGMNIQQVLGPQYDSIIDDKVNNVFHVLKSLTGAKDFGLLGATTRQLATTKADVANQALNDPGIGPTLRAATVLQETGGSQMWSPEFMSQMIGQGLARNFTGSLMNFSQAQLFRAAGQTGNPDPTRAGGAYTHTQSQEEIDRAAKLASSPRPDVTGAYKNLLDFHKALLEKNPATVDSAITYFYHPENKSSLDRLMESYYDPSKNMFVRGRSDAFTDLTQQGIAKNVYKRSKEGNSNAWDWYKDWVTEQAAKGLALNSSMIGGGNIAYNINQNAVTRSDIPRNWWETAINKFNRAAELNYHYDTETHQLGLLNKKGEPVTNSVLYSDPQQVAVRNANKYFAGLVHVAKEEGINPDTLIFDAMHRAGLDPKAIQAIISAYTPPEPKAGEK